MGFSFSRFFINNCGKSTFNESKGWLTHTFHTGGYCQTRADDTAFQVAHFSADEYSSYGISLLYVNWKNCTDVEPIQYVLYLI